MTSSDSLRKLNLLRRIFAKGPYRLVLDEGKEASNPIRFFRGVGASIADLRDGLGVDRSVNVGSRESTFTDFAALLSKAPPGELFMLSAHRGEGKTTFLRQLAVNLESSSTFVVRWNAVERHEPSRINDAIAQTNATFVMIAELDPRWSSSGIGLAASLSDVPLPCPFLLAGAPSELADCPISTPHRVTFAQLPDTSAEKLVTQLRRVLDQYDETQLQEELPNLKTFFDNPDPSVFSRGSLIIGLLEATYGLTFRDKLADEYRLVGTKSTGAQRVYRYACYLHGVGLDLPLHLLKRLAIDDLDAILHRFSDGRPLERTVNEQGETLVRTRNSLIAETVLINANLLDRTSFEQEMNDLFAAVEAAQSADDIGLIRSILAGYQEWDPVFQCKSHVKGDIRSSLRAVLVRRTDLLESARKIVAQSKDWGQAGSWAAVMHHLLPDKQEATSETKLLLDENRAWLDLAQTVFPPRLQPTIKYLQGKGRLLQWRYGLNSAKPSANPVEDVLRDWEQLLGKDSLTGDFYFELGVLARDERRYELAVKAFEYALALGGRRPNVQIAYSKMLNELYPKLRGESFLNLLKVGWEISRSLKSPNAQTGTWLAQELRVTNRNDAVAVLKEVLDAYCWGEALFRLAELAERDNVLQAYVVEYFEDHADSSAWRSPINAAPGRHAGGLVYGYVRNQTKQVLLLNKACDSYEDAAKVDLRKMWPMYGEDMWRRAVDKLKELSGAQAVRTRTESWRSAERLWQQSLRSGSAKK